LPLAKGPEELVAVLVEEILDHIDEQETSGHAR
jgi:hypothetical protein